MLNEGYDMNKKGGYRKQFSGKQETKSETYYPESSNLNLKTVVQENGNKNLKTVIMKTSN